MGTQVVYTNSSSNAESLLRSQAAARSNAYDAVDKLKTSNPQSLIDTDFEYGQQATKWEQVALQQNRQSTYYITNASLPVTAITGNQTNKYQLVVTTSSNVTIATGTTIFIEDTLDPNANGWFYVTTGVTAGTSFTVQGSNQVTTVNCWSATSTYVYQGYFYSGCGIALTGTTAVTYTGTTITVTTAFPHGLSVGSYIFVVGLTASTNAPNGAFSVATVPTTNTFTYSSVAIGTPTGTIGNTAGQTNIYARPHGWIDTHAYDGSVNFTVGASIPNATLFRQTRRYFRYQSGKGIQFSTGTILKPQLQQPVITSSGTTATVTAIAPHNLTVGTYVQVAGYDQSAYNGIFRIATVPTLTTFTYVTATTPTTTTATATVPSIGHVSPYSWYGSNNRIGFGDLQNGFYFQFDGQTLYAVLRNSINQISGTVSVTQGNGTVTGTGTAFSTQLIVGDYIIIRGQSYRVLSIASDTQLYISPEYRGATIANAIVSRTIDTKVPQSQWWDTLDGSLADGNAGTPNTNPSGYKLDLTKVQMFYIDYSWYGAGVVRFGLRTTGGVITWIYGFQNNNIQYSAYLRSGNLPSHYEQSNVTPLTTITASVGVSDTTINVLSTFGFNPAGGTAILRAAASGGAIEYIAYTGLTATTLTGVTRGQTGGGAASAFTYLATAPVSVEYATPDSAAMLSHWGSSVVMDGGYTQDVSALFNYGMTSAITTTAVASYPIMAIRIAPSVDNGTVGTLGNKEIINRLQLQLREIALYTTGAYLVQFILNGVTTGFTATFASPTQNNTNTSSISQVAINTSTGASITGGESIAAFYTQASGQTSLDLTSLSAFGNAALGGGTSNAVPNSQSGTYPDGPDILYVTVSALSATSATAQARLTWAESQA